MSASNAFNTEAIQAFVAREWLDVTDALNDPTIPMKDKPKVYKCESGNVATKNKLAKDVGSTMANQKDFLEELRRQLTK